VEPSQEFGDGTPFQIGCEISIHAYCYGVVNVLLEMVQSNEVLEEHSALLLLHTQFKAKLPDCFSKFRVKVKTQSTISLRVSRQKGDCPSVGQSPPPGNGEVAQESKILLYEPVIGSLDRVLSSATLDPDIMLAISSLEYLLLYTVRICSRNQGRSS
jgi:hypothetical protein